MRHMCISVLAIVMICGCTNTSRRHMECSPEGNQCPEGLVCNDGQCVSISDSDTVFDADIDAERDSVEDADKPDDAIPDVDEGVPDSDPDVDEECTELWCSPEWVLIPAGTFVMGSPESEAGRHVGEQAHEVMLTNDFYMQTTEVTRYQFERIMGYDPSIDAVCTEACPVGAVSWNEAALYCNFISIDAGLPICYECGAASLVCELNPEYVTPYDCPGYRLPTEAEWEYAARAGTTTATYNGNLDVEPDDCGPSGILGPIAWYCGVDSGRPAQPVAQLLPNAHGLYDMLGNRVEAVNDWHEPYPAAMAITNPFGALWGENKVYRGGDSWTIPQNVRSASRQAFPADSDLNLGFRPVRTAF